MRTDVVIRDYRDTDAAALRGCVIALQECRAAGGRVFIADDHERARWTAADGLKAERSLARRLEGDFRNP